MKFLSLNRVRAGFLFFGCVLSASSYGSSVKEVIQTFPGSKAELIAKLEAMGEIIDLKFTGGDRTLTVHSDGYTRSKSGDCFWELPEGYRRYYPAQRCEDKSADPKACRRNWAVHDNDYDPTVRHNVQATLGSMKSTITKVTGIRTSTHALLEARFPQSEEDRLETDEKEKRVEQVEQEGGAAAAAPAPAKKDS